MNERLDMGLWEAIFQSFYDSKDYHDSCVIRVTDKTKFLDPVSCLYSNNLEGDEIPTIELHLVPLNTINLEYYIVEILDILRRTDGTLTPIIDRKDFEEYFKHY